MFFPQRKHNSNDKLPAEAELDPNNLLPNRFRRLRLNNVTSVDEAKGKFKALFVPLYDSSLRWSHHATSCTGFALSIYVELLFELIFAADKIDAFPLIHACWFTDPSFTV